MVTEFLGLLELLVIHLAYGFEERPGQPLGYLWGVFELEVAGKRSVGCGEHRKPSRHRITDQNIHLHLGFISRRSRSVTTCDGWRNAIRLEEPITECLSSAVLHENSMNNEGPSEVPLNGPSIAPSGKSNRLRTGQEFEVMS
jgi:hypothetical protein